MAYPLARTAVGSRADSFAFAAPNLPREASRNEPIIRAARSRRTAASPLFLEARAEGEKMRNFMERASVRSRDFRPISYILLARESAASASAWRFDWSIGLGSTMAPAAIRNSLRRVSRW